MEKPYSDTAPVKVKLLQGAIYDDDPVAWKLILANEDPLREFFRELGQTLIVDRAEGWAYLEQDDLDGHENMVQLFKRRPVSFEATVVLLLLREELLRFDGTPRAVETVPTVTLSWLVDELSAFVPDQNNLVKRDAALKAVVRQVVSMGVLREIKNDENDTTYQILRIVKAKLPEAKISEIRERLRAQPTRTEEPDNGDQPAD